MNVYHICSMTYNNANMKLTGCGQKECSNLQSSQSHKNIVCMHITNKKKNGGAHTTSSSLPSKNFANPKSANFGV
jgi:hypothetical protein